MFFERLHLGAWIAGLAVLTGCIGGPGATEVSASVARAQPEQGTIGVGLEPRDAPNNLVSASATFVSGRSCTRAPVGACVLLSCSAHAPLVSAGSIHLDVGAETIDMLPNGGIYRSDPFRWTDGSMQVHVDGAFVPAFDTEIERQAPVVVTSTSPPLKAGGLTVAPGSGISIAWVPTNGEIDASLSVVTGSVSISCSADGSQGRLELPADLVAKIKAEAAPSGSKEPPLVELSVAGTLDRNILIGAWGITVGSTRFASLDGRQMLVGVSFQ